MSFDRPVYSPMCRGVKPHTIAGDCLVCKQPLCLPYAVRYLPDIPAGYRSEQAGAIGVVVHQRCASLLDAAIRWNDGVDVVPEVVTSTDCEVSV